MILACARLNLEHVGICTDIAALLRTFFLIGKVARGNGRSQYALRLAREVLHLVAFLWEASTEDTFWNDAGHLQLGIMHAGKRARRITGAFKRSLVLETMNLRGDGISKPQQLLQGINVADKRGSSCLGLRSRFGKVMRSSGVQPAKRRKLCDISTSHTVENFEVYNY